MRRTHSLSHNQPLASASSCPHRGPLLCNNGCRKGGEDRYQPPDSPFVLLCSVHDSTRAAGIPGDRPGKYASSRDRTIESGQGRDDDIETYATHVSEPDGANRPTGSVDDAQLLATCARTRRPGMLEEHDRCLNVANEIVDGQQPSRRPGVPSDLPGRIRGIRRFEFGTLMTVIPFNVADHGHPANAAMAETERTRSKCPSESTPRPECRVTMVWYGIQPHAPALILRSERPHPPRGMT